MFFLRRWLEKRILNGENDNKNLLKLISKYKNDPQGLSEFFLKYFDVDKSKSTEIEREQAKVSVAQRMLSGEDLSDHLKAAFLKDRNALVAVMQAALIIRIDNRMSESKYNSIKAIGDDIKNFVRNYQDVPDLVKKCLATPYDKWVGLEYEEKRVVSEMVVYKMIENNPNEIGRIKDFIQSSSGLFRMSSWHKEIIGEEKHNDIAKDTGSSLSSGEGSIFSHFYKNPNRKTIKRGRPIMIR